MQQILFRLPELHTGLQRNPAVFQLMNTERWYHTIPFFLNMRVCVYCASSSRIDQVYFDATRRLGKLLVDEGVSVVFGGGGAGLMGCLADTVLHHNGEIQGIMPEFMNDVEWAHKGVKNFVFTKTMAQRKAKFLEDIDGLIALPGGSGTLEELLEAITLKRLGKFLKPIVILNLNGFYDPLKAMLERCVEKNFMHTKHLDMWTFVDQPEQVMEALHAAPSWNENAIHLTSSLAFPTRTAVVSEEEGA